MIKSTWEQKLNINDKKQLEIRERFKRAHDNKQNLIENYIREMIIPINDDMSNIRDFAREHSIPIIQPETERFLSQIISLQKPKKILEIGTAIGYSALVFAYAMHSGHIDTIEKSEDMICYAKQNIKLAPKDVFINIISGNGEDEIHKLASKQQSEEQKYNFVFIDAAKGHYMTFLNAAMPLINDGAIIISDNIFYGGLIARDRYDVPRRQRTIYKRMRDYLEYLMNTPEFDTSLLNIGDGIALSVYNGDKI